MFFSTVVAGWNHRCCQTDLSVFFAVKPKDEEAASVIMALLGSDHSVVSVVVFLRTGGSGL